MLDNKKNTPHGAEEAEKGLGNLDDAKVIMPDGDPADRPTVAEINAKGKAPGPAEEAGEAGPEASQAENLPEKSEFQLLQEKYAELEDRNLRLMAEYDNYRKRTSREKDEAYGNATAAALERFLSIADNFERAMGYEKGGEDFAKGFEMIAQSFSELLASFGVEPVGAVGEPFDPNLHNAVMHIEDESLGENVVSQVLQKGYRMGERILRYAMVQTAN